MSQTDRNRRLRLLLRELNRRRKQQASQIDILCHDLIGAQRTFLKRLDGIGFAAQFYKSLLGCTDLNTLLTRAGRLFQGQLPGAGVAFFLRQPDGLLHVLGNGDTLPLENPRPEEYFSPELMNSICKANRPCSLDDMVGMGLEGDLKDLSRFSVATLPLNDLGRPLGFVLFYRRLPQVLTGAELRGISPVLCGLAQALRAARVPLPVSR
jgi:hypothetical protein